MLYVGIDPGLNGGIAVVDESGFLRWAVAMPVVGKQIDVKKVVEDFPPVGQIRCVCIERQQAFPKQGAVSAFTTGFNYGMLLATLKGIGVSTLEVRPAEWQADMLKGKPKGDLTKASALLVVDELWAGHDWRATPRCKVAHDGMVDAALLAEYGRRKIECLLR